MYYREEGTIIEKGIDHIVTIKLPYGKVYKDVVVQGYKFTINETSTIIGEGEVLEILNKG
ncbi:hypothetical protein DL897_06345 [Thermoflavimicrobium daqui]|uniref:Uncharacterized protein n=1 Tax=Thermoflavimicrobium daqui TaxID=2137476 RepID=A0A364K656_9BACL|nr:hypothetical protein DL897_06345 [Thermoflavimicrobium daqui]